MDLALGIMELVDGDRPHSNISTIILYLYPLCTDTWGILGTRLIVQTIY